MEKLNQSSYRNGNLPYWLARVYNFIISFYNLNGYMPTIREISRGTGIKSKSDVFRRLRHLEKRGYIQIIPKKCRGIKLIT